jgi:chemotaxis protein MotA
MFGLVGTIFGIVRVLQNMSNPETVGPSMALALTSALYGIIFSNLLCVPVANRIRSQALDNLTQEELILVAVVGMATNHSPALLETEMRMIYAHPQQTILVSGKSGETSTPS